MRHEMATLRNALVSSLVKNGGCSDPFDTFKVEDHCIQCSKYEAKQGSLNVLIRGCESEALDNNGCASWKQNGASGELSLCDTDRCNAASAPVAYIPILLVACALAAKTTFMY
ncbi:hypothetical protein DPMN_150786 [Dreissena polymorpha]|uniref:Protein quiver n=1 Tax=Dreissena polymorpha TaxID=45954 RepID=A0A9D4J3N4_DREPO|nr:hypothetical protein DPMN_150786 [Dreissena polymorpha]